MLEIPFGAIAAKAGFGIVSSVATTATTAAIKKFKDPKQVQLPSSIDVKYLVEWYGTQISEAVIKEDGSLDPNLEKYLSSHEFATLVHHLFVHLFAGERINENHRLLLQMRQGSFFHGYANDEDLAVVYRLVTALSEKIYNLSKAGDSELSGQAYAEAAAIVTNSILNSIESQMERMYAADHPSLSEVNDLISKYRQAVLSKHGKIQPQSFDGAKFYNIDDLYVVPRIAFDGSDGWVGNQIDIQRMISDHGRVVVVGDPGGGKTTLSSKVACDLAAGVISYVGLSRQIIPFIVVLRNFGTFLKSGKGSVIDYIVETSASIYQVKIPESVVSALLDSGRLYVIFDGLDELTDTSNRIEISQTIGVFASLFPTAGILVTSRRVGYSHNALDEEVFTKFGLMEFDLDQVKRYVENWFRLTPQLGTQEERSRAASNFVSESIYAQDIRTNPLMLGLMCTIYRSESYIPRNRPDLYAKCSKMLFKTWDASRGIGDPLKFEAHIDDALAYLASIIYESPALQSGMTERDLVSTVAAYFIEWAVNVRPEAVAAAEEFISLCKGRAWVLADAGLDESGESLFKFTHRTFLEYFTAVHLWYTADGIDEVCDVVIPRVIKGELDVVAELTLQMAARSKRGGADRVFRKLFLAFQCAESLADKVVIHNLMLRSLSFLVLSPGAVDEIVPQFIGSIFILLKAEYPEEDEDSVQELKTELVTTFALFGKCVRESVDAVRRAVCQKLERLFVDASMDAELLCSVAWDLPVVFGYSVNGSAESLAGLPDDLRSLQSATEPYLISHRNEWPWAAVALFYHGRIRASEVLLIDPGAFLLNGVKIPYINKIYHPPAWFIISLALENASDEEGRGSVLIDIDDSIQAASDYIENNAPLALYTNHEFDGPRKGPVDALNLSIRQSFTGNLLVNIPDVRLNEIALLVCFCFEAGRSRFGLQAGDYEKIEGLPERLGMLWELLRLRQGEPAINVAGRWLAEASPLQRWATRVINYTVAGDSTDSFDDQIIEFAESTESNLPEA